MNFEPSILTCPKCGAHVPSVNINPFFEVAICPTYSCENIIPCKADVERKIQIEKMKAPPDIEVEPENGRLKIRVKADAETDTKGCLISALAIVFLIQLLFPLPDINQAPEFFTSVLTRIVFLILLALSLFGFLKPSNSPHHRLIIAPKFIESHPYAGWLGSHWLNNRGVYIRRRAEKVEVWLIGKKIRMRRPLLGNLREDQAVYIAQVIKHYLS